MPGGEVGPAEVHSLFVLSVAVTLSRGFVCDIMQDQLCHSAASCNRTRAFLPNTHSPYAAQCYVVPFYGLSPILIFVPKQDALEFGKIDSR